MDFFFFWPFRVLGFILTLYALLAFAENFLPNLISGNAGAIISMIAIIGSALFWINFVDLYLKLMNPDQKKIRTKKGKKKKKQSLNIFSNISEIILGILRGIVSIIEFVLGLINPLILFIILITILVGLAS